MRAVCKLKVQFRGLVYRPGDVVEIGEGEINDHVRNSFTFEGKPKEERPKDKEGREWLSSEEYKRRLSAVRASYPENASQEELRKIYRQIYKKPNE